MSRLGNGRRIGRNIGLALLLTAMIGLLGYSVIEAVAKQRAGEAMAASANAFIASLNAEQRTKALFKFEDEQRKDFYFVPRTRFGVTLKDLDEKQRKLAMDFLRTGLGVAGYQKATTIISLEPILFELEGAKRIHPRDPELYYISLFGTPSAKSPWGWRFEGHHLSVNVTVVKGELIANSPLFMGSNPAEVREGPHKGLRTLAGEEDEGRALVQSLDDKQRQLAIYLEKAPADILTMNSRKVDPLKPEGLSTGQMTAVQRKQLMKLIDVYLARMPQEVADARRTKLNAGGIGKISFAWAGGLNKGDYHYYRVQGPTFLIEYDDTQNNANHIHSVWRDFKGDFGVDLLAEHYRTQSHNQTAAR